MKRVLIWGLALLALTGCGGNGGGGGDLLAGGGIAGTGRTTGPITGFGSIFVGGIEWDLTAADITVNGVATSEAELALGMVVTVIGEFGDDGLTGVASSVEYALEIEGPVSGVTVVGAGGEVKELEILGWTVVVERGATTFDREHDPDFSFDTIAVDDVVEVSGLRDEAGRLRATRVAKEGDLVIGATEVELKGVVTDFDGAGSFRLGTVTVTFDAAGGGTILEGLPGGIADGVAVKVKGLLTAPGEVRATKIEGQDDEEDGDFEKARVEGFVTDFASIADFRVDGQRVDASGAVIEGGTAGSVRDGVRVEVEGPIRDGVLHAVEVSIRTTTAEIRAEVRVAEDVDPGGATLTLLGIRVEVNGATHFEDEGAPFGLADIRAGDVLAVRGIATEDGAVVATRIEIDDEHKVLLRGPVQSFDAGAGTVTVLGVTVGSDDDTEYEDASEQPLNRAEFFDRLAPGVVVKIEEEDDDATSIEVADEMDLEG